MLLSWNWLKQYVTLDMPADELTRRLMMAGLNHESTSEVAGDLAIDVEVTSNRPDCLGHLGIAREIAVLFGRPLNVPAARPAENGPPVAKLTKVRIDCPDLCYRYTAHVVRGAKVGPSPKWLARRLETIGLTPVNNIVDISNYVLMECGQPLHTFDMAKLQGPEIVVRRPRPGEIIQAIDHREYRLEPEMCIIADAEEAVAIGGVMGGAKTEISAATTDILVEAAEFNPISIRSTARKLNLHSDSSYRFERRIDPEGVEWASRRCCELILELCGGELAAGVIDVGQQPPRREAVTLRLTQLKRILGIEVPADEVERILVALGCQAAESGPSAKGFASHSVPGFASHSCTVTPPSWRRDLTREIDLVEEVARIHGYEQIPEDVSVPMAPSHRTREDRVLDAVRGVVTACGFDEAMTISLVDEATSQAMSPWTESPALQSLMPVLRGADRLRRSLVPSLLAARRTNEALANPEIELFEIAKVYLPHGDDLPDEERMLALTSGRSFAEVKGVVESIIAALRAKVDARVDDAGLDVLDANQACRFESGGRMLGYVGRISDEAQKQFDLRGPTTVAELRLAPLVEAAELTPQYAPLSTFPAVSRDINLVVDDAVRWTDVATTARGQCGAYFEELQYRDTYRDPQRLGAGKKSLLFSVVLRSTQGTMTSQQADELRDRIVTACRKEHGAELRA